MKLTASPVVDYMDWLKIQEEFLLYQLDVPSQDNMFVADIKDELRIVREIKDIVKLWGMSHES